MRIIFGLMTLLLALAIVGSLAKNQLQALGQIGSTSTRAPTDAEGKAVTDAVMGRTREGAATAAVPGGMGGMAGATPAMVEGTVPIGFVKPSEGVETLTTSLDYGVGDGYASTGQFGDFYGKGFPDGLTLDEAFVQRGKERYAISCTPCHGYSGNGVGIVSKYWAIPPTANLIDPRVKDMPEGQIFWTITHGKGLMGPYSGAIPVRDRWAIVAYVRALQAASN